MRKILLLFMGIFWGFSVNAQLPQWVIRPENDTIFVKVDSLLLQTINKGQSSLWTMDGKKLYSTENVIMPFREGVASIVRKNNNTIVGLVNCRGTFFSLPEPTVAYDNPFFENGNMLVIADNEFVYYSLNGATAKKHTCILAYPFHRGYATYFTYSQLDKRKDPYYNYLTPDGRRILYKINTNGNVKLIDSKDIAFLSSISADDRGVAVIKDKLYWFNIETESFEPFLWGEMSEKKRHLSVVSDNSASFTDIPEEGLVIQAKYGKNQIAQLCFDNQLLPTVFHFMDEDIVFEEPKKDPVCYNTVLTAYGEDEHGLAYKADTASVIRPLLPVQFENTGLMYENKAFVKKDGKWGVVEILPDLKMSLKINKGEDVAFRHQKFETQIRLDLPVEISAKETRLDISEITGCLLDKTSREARDTESGNYVTYDCVLNIPPSLPDTMTAIQYSPIEMSYDGIALFPGALSVNAWHLKYYNVDPIESETSITDGVASFTININAQKNVGEGDYPFEVKVHAEELALEGFEKISETRYKCSVSNLQEGVNNLNILVIEKGCPPSVFPFEVIYTKPVPQEELKEKVVVRKRAPVIPAQSKTPTARIEL